MGSSLIVGHRRSGRLSFTSASTYPYSDLLVLFHSISSQVLGGGEFYFSKGNPIRPYTTDFPMQELESFLSSAHTVTNPCFWTLTRMRHLPTPGLKKKVPFSDLQDLLSRLLSSSRHHASPSCTPLSAFLHPYRLVGATHRHRRPM